MVSELLQDRPRLVKQIGSIIFILVYKWIFKFPLVYLNRHQRSTLLQSPSSLNQIPWKVLRKEATVISPYGLLLVLLVPVAKPSQTPARLAQCHSSLEVSLLPMAAWGVGSPLMAPQSPIRCQNSRAEAAWELHGSSGRIPQAPCLSSFSRFCPVINSRSVKDLNSLCSTQGLSGERWLARVITNEKTEIGHFRRDVHLKTCPWWGTAWERPTTQQTSLHFCSSHYLFCKSLTHRHTGQVHFPLLRV